MLHIYLTYLLLPAPEMQEPIRIVVPKVKAEWKYVTGFGKARQLRTKIII